MKHADRVLATGLIAVLLTCSIACNSSTALSYVKKFQPVVVNALVLSCAISSGLPICGTMQTTIDADYTLVVKLWGDWNTAVANGTSTVALWNDLNAAFTTFENDSAQIFAVATGLNAPEVTAIVVSAETLLAVIESLFPSAPAATSVTSSRRFKTALPQNFNFKGWKRDYNEKIDIAHRIHPNAAIKKV